MNRTVFKDCSTALFKTYPVFRQAVYEAFDRHSTRITRTQQTILITMMNSGILSMSELARNISTSNEQATRAVSQLVERGFISRVQNENNRRVINISLTESARAFLDEVIQLAADQLSAKLAAYSSADVKKISDSLVTIAKIL